MPSVKYKNGSGWFSITNSGLKATEITYGVAKVATKAELEAGLSDDTFVTPKKVRDIFYEKNHGILHYDWIGTLDEYNEQYAEQIAYCEELRKQIRKLKGETIEEPEGVE